MSKQINLVLASDDNYAQHAAITMLSAYAKCSTPESLKCYILDGGISAEKKDRIIRSVDQFKGKVEFIKIDSDRFKDLYTSFQYTAAIYYRLELPNVLPAELHKCLYVDCDLLFLDDIKKLWDTDMGDFPVAAVEDVGLMTSKKGFAEKQNTLGLKSGQKYFNSGVVLMNLDVWRKNDYSAQAIELAVNNEYSSHDQDILNKLFLGNWQELDLRWNIIPPITYLYPKILVSKEYCQLALKALKKPGILHYAGRYKSWEFKEYEVFNGYYYELLKASAFKDVVMPQLSKQNIGRNFTKELLRLYLASFLQKLL